MANLLGAFANQDAVDNLRFAKQQQWRVINYAALVYAALFFVRDKGWFGTEGGKEL